MNRTTNSTRGAHALTLAILCTTLLGSPVSANEKDRPRTPPPPTPGPDEAVVYIYRTQSTALSLRGATFFIDNLKAVTLGYHGCTAIVVSAGPHVLKQTWPLDISFGRSASLPAEWKAGETYYYRFDVDQTAFYPTAVFHWRTDELSSGAGQESVSDCRYTPPMDLSKLKPKS